MEERTGAVGSPMFRLQKEMPVVHCNSADRRYPMRSRRPPLPDSAVQKVAASNCPAQVTRYHGLSVYHFIVLGLSHNVSNVHGGCLLEGGVIAHGHVSEFSRLPTFSGQSRLGQGSCVVSDATCWGLFVVIGD